MIFDIKNESDTDVLRKAWAGMRVGLTSGSFDLFHHMHLIYLLRCRRQCDVLIVGVDSNDLVSLRKGPKRPLVPEHQRVAIVGALNCVAGAFIMGRVEDFEFATAAIKASVIFKNHAFDAKEVLGRDLAEVVILPDLKQHSSTTEIIEQITRGQQ